MGRGRILQGGLSAIARLRAKVIEQEEQAFRGFIWLCLLQGGDGTDDLDAHQTITDAAVQPRMEALAVQVLAAAAAPPSDSSQSSVQLASLQTRPLAVGRAESTGHIGCITILHSLRDRSGTHRKHRGTDSGV